MFHVKQPPEIGWGAPYGVSRETLQRLKIYVGLLLKWNHTINLISRRDEAIIWQRHIEDCLALLPLLPAGFPHAIDLGSGGGLPGLVLAIASDRPFHLVEADQRKAAFLREAARATGASVTVHALRIEQADLPPTRVVTARALAPLDELLGWAHRLLAPGGVALFPKGRSATEELTQAAARWQMRVEQHRSPTDPTATILKISEIIRVGPVSRSAQ
jgi:16S rRNA (guanine527-N7)-methyltransferase